MSSTPRIETFRDQLLLDIPLVDGAFTLLGQMPGYKKWIGRKLLFRPTGANIEFVLSHFPNASWIPPAQEHRNHYQQTQLEIDATLAAKETILTTPDNSYHYGTKPYRHQEQAFLLSREKEIFALLMEQGCGKTKVIIDTAFYLRQQDRIGAVVVVAPNGVHRMWAEIELPIHSPKPFAAFIYSAGKSESRLQKEYESTCRRGKLPFFCFNVEGFTSNRACWYLEETLSRHPCLFIVDESSRIKTPSTQRTRYLIKAGRTALYRRILTGTPVTKGLQDLYSQFKFLDPMIIGYDSFTTFRNHYCIMGGWQFRQIVGYNHVEELQRSVAGFSYRITKAECLDLPPKIYKRYPVELSSKQRALYQQLKIEFEAEFENHRVDGSLALVRLLRLQQIVCNWFPTGTDNPLVRPIDARNPRLQALLDILEDTEGKVIIWARFRADLNLIIKSLSPGQTVSYYGDTPGKQRNQAVYRFQNDPSIRYFVGNPQTAGLGVTLTAAETEIYYSNSFDLEHRIQSEDRAHRIGQQHHLTIIDLEATRTIDRKIIQSLRAKKSIADTMTRDPKSFFLEAADES